MAQHAKKEEGGLPRIRVTAALIEEDGSFLAAQRPEDARFPLMWEFPGGKVRDEETLEECLKRELEEELGLEVSSLSSFMKVSHAYEEFEVELNVFSCRCLNTSDMVVKEHRQVRWLMPSQMDPESFLEADRAVIMRLREVAG